MAQPLKMTSVISLPRSDLGALRAEHPFDGVDDVRLARPVRPDDDGDAARKLEPRAIGEALEAGEFEGFEHGESRSLGSRVEESEQ